MICEKPKDPLCYRAMGLRSLGTSFLGILTEKEKIMKLSTRNVIKGKVVDVKDGMIMSKVKVDIGGGNIVTSLIRVEAVKELGVTVGGEVYVLIKATSVMLATD